MSHPLKRKRNFAVGILAKAQRDFLGTDDTMGSFVPWTCLVSQSSSVRPYLTHIPKVIIILFFPLLQSEDKQVKRIHLGWIF